MVNGFVFVFLFVFMFTYPDIPDNFAFKHNFDIFIKIFLLD